MNPSHNPKRVLVTSLMMCLILSVCPWPESVEVWMPQWALLFVLAWVLYLPMYLSLFGVMLTGLFVDMLTGGIWGTHALVFTIMAFFAFKLRLRFTFYHVWQQTIIVSLFSTCYLGMLYWIHFLLGQQPTTWHYWASIIPTVLSWPFVVFAVRHFLKTSLRSA